MIRAATLAALLLGTALPATAQTPIAQAPVAPKVEVKPLAFTQRTLANGLRVYGLRDATTPNVAVQVWYDVGAKDDPKDRSGFAHLFEHLMFKATRNLVPEQFDRLTEDVGGYNNASTDDDFTNYFEVVPANHLERLLFAEADRMANLAIEPASFASERSVVEEEYRQSVLARPYGKLFSTYLPMVAYSRHPYARGVIGSIANLDAASIDDVRAFHAAYYRPDNAVLVVSGNYDPAQLDTWVDRYFGGIARPATPIQRVTVTEPPRTAPITRTVYEPNTPLPAVVATWHVPPDRNADVGALTVLEAILATGDSSRLYQTLVYRDRLANSVDASLDTRQGVGNLTLNAVMASGKDPAAGEAALLREVARLRDAPVDAAEVARARTQIVTAALQRRQTAEGRGFTLAAAAIIDGDPHAADAKLAAIQRVTAADVQRVARAWLGERQVATIRYLPAEAKPAGATGDTIALAPSVAVAPLVAPASVAVVTPADAAHRRAPPVPGLPVKPVVPAPVETRLANGLRVVTVERHDLPLVTAALVATGGSGTDPHDRAGAASLAATVMTRGTATRSATDVAAQMEALGASIASDAGRDSDLVSATVTSGALAPALAILADVARHPAFAADEIERARVQAIDGVAVAMSSPPQLAALVANRLVFSGDGYGAPVEGTPTSLAAIGRGDLQRSYAATWQPAQTALVLIGDVTPAAAQALAQRLLGDWSGSRVAVGPKASAPLAAPRIVVVDMPDAGQAGVVVARAGIRRADPRYYALQVANGVLGGGFSSRLNQEIRIKRGLAYGAGSSVSARAGGGVIAARTQTKNPTAPDVVALIRAEMARMGTAPVAAAELDTRKAATIGDIGRGIETTQGLAGVIGGYVATGVPVTEIGQVVGRLAAVDAAAVRQVSAALLDPAPASIVVAGDARQFLPALKAAYPQVEVIPAGTLTLDTASLRRER